MNRGRLKSYAPKARLDFIRAVTDRARKIGLTSSSAEPVLVSGDVAFIVGQQFPRVVAEQRRKLDQRIDQHGFHAVIEAAAYTWFNRFMALRYMELHGFLDHGFRVLSHPNRGIRPEVLEHAQNLKLPGLATTRIVDLKLDGTKDEELYRLLILGQCHALHLAMPFLFERIDDETELLLPDNLLSTDSIVRKMVQDTADEDWEQIEVIGWLYQFYISDRKAEVIGKVVKSEDIPAATQLFTPNWIVKYMVQNSLGRKWLDTYPHSNLRAKMEYYIAPAGQTEEVQAQLAAITPKELNPEELTLIDPACGSGHILCEAYDLFKGIYLERGYRLRDIPRLILQKNLFGLDIDDRAAQMAGFALLMKARADDRKILEVPPKLSVMALQSSAGLNAQEIADALSLTETFELVPSGELFPETKRQLSLTAETTAESGLEDIAALLELFENAKTLGSLITVPNVLAAHLQYLSSLVETNRRGADILRRQAAADLEPFVAQAMMLAQVCDAVVTNPPYMSKGINSLLKGFAQHRFPKTKSDLFAMFTERAFGLAKPDGYIALMTPFVWMFLKSYEQLRLMLVSNCTIQSLIRPEYHAFFDSAFVPICTFVISMDNQSKAGTFIDLSAFYGEALQPIKALEAISDRECSWRYNANSSDFLAVRGTPIAYQLGKRLNSLYRKHRTLDKFASVKEGLNTGDNARFLRLWHEVDFHNIGFGCTTREGAIETKKTWFPCNKGGSLRRWYGNNDYIIHWKNDGELILSFRDTDGRLLSAPRNLQYLFRSGLTWSGVGSSGFSARAFPDGFIFNSAGRSLFSEANSPYLLGFLNSVISQRLLEVLAPTLSFTVGDIANLPMSQPSSDASVAEIEAGVEAMIELSRMDWDSRETSWDFGRSTLLREQSCVESSTAKCAAQCSDRITRLQRLEQVNNELFISSYDLEGELRPSVDIDQITLDKADHTQTIQRLISFAIGCMMGRYSLDEPGLIYAQSGNHGFDPNRHLKFPADDDGIIPITDTDWFGSADIANRFAEFLSAAWPPESLAENLKFVADSLSPKPGEAPIDTIRRYLCTGLYKDHLQTYKRRPIYWLFSSGKERAFQALVYLHRYNEGTLSRMRIEYVIPLQSRMIARIEQLKQDIEAVGATADRRKREKEREKLVRQHEELRKFDEKLRHYADMRISLDLDDGVKVNYGKFGDLLAEVKAVTGGSDD